jgi:ATP-dependent Lhr-like helicase
VGDTFTLGVQTWRVQRITHNDVFVSPADARSAMAPFWRAEERDRSAFLSERIGRFLESALPRLEDPALVEDLQHDHHLEPNAAAELRRLLAEQVAATGTLPHRHQIVVEHTPGPGRRTGHRQTVLHTMWGGRVNRPFSYALAAAWATEHGSRPEVIHGDDCVVINHPVDQAPDDPFALVPPDRIEELLRSSLENTGFFGARFREAAGRALLLPRGGGRRRVPLWLNRQRAKELLELVSESGDFPLVLEAWRECLHDEFELDVLRDRLAELADGRTAVRHVHTETPSPFTEQVAWRQTNTLMYQDDAPQAAGGGRLRSDLVRELALSSSLRPRVSAELTGELRAKVQRTAPGYAPRDHRDLLDWTRERLMIPEPEWRELLDAMVRDHGVDRDRMTADVAHRVAGWRPLGPDSQALVCAVENIPVLAEGFGVQVEADQLDPPSLDGGSAREAVTALESMAAEGILEASERSAAELFGEWLSYYGPVNRTQLARWLPFEPAIIDSAIEELTEADQLVADQITEGTDDVEICDRQNLERLLRMARAAARPSLQPRPATDLPLYLAHHQRLATEAASIDDLKSVLETLVGWSAPAELVEAELLPARIAGYQPQWLDTLLAETDLEWFGSGDRKISFGLAGDRSLVAPTPPESPTSSDELFPTTVGRYTLDELLQHTKLSSSELVERLWDGVWSGQISADSFAPVRHGVANRFSVEPLGRAVRARGRRRMRFDRWQSRLPAAGGWRLMSATEAPLDALDREEDDRERARLVLDRYGILFRELVERELPALRWRSLFRSLRMLELAGEVVAGRFFDGIPGLQFMSLPALRSLQEGPPADRIWWLNAVDPASPCGLGAVDLGLELPRRVPSNHVVFHGRRLVVVSERRGGALTIHVPVDHPRLADYLGFLREQLGRAVRPRRSITIETINGEPATTSLYRDVLQYLFHVTRTPTALRLSRKY